MSNASEARTKTPAVIIAGGGPVGMGLAIELGQRDIGCCVIERHAQPQPIPKGQNLTQRTMEHFAAWNVDQRIRQARMIPRDFGIRGLTAYGTLLSDYHYDWFQRDKVAAFYAAENERLPQYETENVLRRRARELDCVELLTEWTVSSASQSANGASVCLQSNDGSASKTLHTEFVVGCDGSSSVVRQCAGITQTKEDHDKRMVLLVIRSRALHQLLERYPGKSYFNVINPDLDGYWQFLGRVDLGETFFFHAPVPSSTTRHNFDFKSLLHEVVGQSFPLELDYIGFWDLRIATADNYNAGRLFVAGDAAHSHPPYGGYGINTGFEDARNLGWKLAATISGWAGNALLASYSSERHPVFESTAHDFIGRYITSDRDFINRFDPERDRAEFEAAWQSRQSGSDFDVVGFEPHYEGSPVCFGPAGGQSSAVGKHQFNAQAGHHLAPQKLPSGNDLFTELGSGFTLVNLTNDEQLNQAFAQAAARAKIPLKIISEHAPQTAHVLQAQYILVRPDHFVAWVGIKPDADAILRHCTGHS